MSGNTFTQTNNGNATGIQGEGNNVTVNHGANVMDEAAFFAALRKELSTVTVPMIEGAKSIEDAAIKPLEQAATNPEKNQKHGVSLEYIAGYFEKLKPYASYVLRVAAAGGDELIKKNAVISAIVRMAQEAVK